MLLPLFYWKKILFLVIKVPVFLGSCCFFSEFESLFSLLWVATLVLLGAGGNTDKTNITPTKIFMAPFFLRV